MPLYDFKCDSCGCIAEQFAKIDHVVDVCQKCGAQTRRIISTNYNVVNDLEPYVDREISGEPIYVRSKQHRAKLLREHDLVERIGKGWT
jgi:putative FmdB family regulatory protein